MSADKSYNRRCATYLLKLALAMLLASPIISRGVLAQGKAFSSCGVLALPSGRAPVADVRMHGARGDGVSDDGDAIGRAIRSLPAAGGTVVFPAGTYRHTDVVRVDRDNVTLAGQQAVLEAGNVDLASVFITGTNVTVRNLEIRTRLPSSRGESEFQSGVLIAAPGARIVGNKILGFKSTGIFVRGSRDHIIACNHVADTRADGIHITQGSRDVRVAGNTVFNSGDDGIAVVSYDVGKRVSSVVIEDNTVENVRWGRGISVIGSVDVIIRGNRVSKIAMAAGIIVAREAAYHTPGARHVRIEGNELRNIQQNIVPLSGAQLTGHGAIELNSDDAGADLAVSHIQVVGNRVVGSAFDGIRLLGNVCGVEIAGNRFSRVRGRAIAVESQCSPAVHRCDQDRASSSMAKCP